MFTLLSLSDAYDRKRKRLHHVYDSDCILTISSWQWIWIGKLYRFSDIDVNLIFAFIKYMINKGAAQSAKIFSDNAALYYLKLTGNGET